MIEDLAPASDSFTPYTIEVVPIDDVSRLLDIPRRTVCRDILSALAKLSAAGKVEQLFALAQCAQAADYGPVLRCGSIECRPEKWVLTND
jgi:hypothetical protein